MNKFTILEKILEKKVPLQNYQYSNMNFSVKACGLVLYHWKCGCAFFGALGAGALGKLLLLGRGWINWVEILTIS